MKTTKKVWTQLFDYNLHQTFNQRNDINKLQMLRKLYKLLYLLQRLNYKVYALKYYLKSFT